MDFESGENKVYLRIGSLALSAGSYVIGAGLAIPNTAWLYNEPHGAIMEVVSRDVYGAGLSPTRTRYPVPMSCCWEMPPQRKQRSGRSWLPYRIASETVFRRSC